MMDDVIRSSQKDGCKKGNLDLQNFEARDIGSAKEDCFSKSLVRGMNKPDDKLLLDIEKSKFSEFWIQKLFLQRISSTEKRIPRQITSLEEIYLRQCMELINLSALRVASPNSLAEIDVLSDNFSSRLICTGNAEENPFIFASGYENVSTGPAGDSVLGTITGSTSMMNILNNPLLRQLRGSDNAAYTGKTDLLDFRETINYPDISASGDFCYWPLQKIEKDRGIPGNRKVGYRNANKRLGSISYSTDSSFSSESSASTSTAFSQGMLHCSWNNEFPHYELTVDDKRETYIANLSKVESSNVKICDYMYKFHSRSGGKKGDTVHGEVLDLVGKMRVLTSFTLCPNNMKIMETQFVLSASSDNFLAEIHQTSGDMFRKNKGSSKKMGKYRILLGCPITLLKTKPSNKDVLAQVDVPGINSFDLFVQGSKQNGVMVKIMSIQDGLYYIQYQSNLSALQSLSIAVAIIHSRSPSLRPKLYRI